MSQALITVAIPFEGALAERVNARLGALGNPAQGPVAQALNAAQFVHFLGIIVVHDAGDATAHLVLEASADGSARGALRVIAATIGEQLREVFETAGYRMAQPAVAGFLEAHRLNLGPGWFSTCGIEFCGTPGVSVARIHEEARFASWMSEWLGRHPPESSALQTLERMRHDAFKSAGLKWAFIAEAVPLIGREPPLADVAIPILASLFRYLLWPLAIPPLLAALYSYYGLDRPLDTVVWDACLILGLEVLVVGAAFWLLYRRLRIEEETDVPGEPHPRALAELESILARENQAAQNHLAGISAMKPGRMRRIVLRFVLWAVQVGAQYTSRPGFLTGIGSIHFARWVLLPGSGKLLFFSNYDGSWVSYLEDFIARGKEGLTAIWSNTRGFPKTRNLLMDGAGDGERFKRWARRQQCVTRFWYTGYPHLTTARIRVNAELRHGFAGASTEEQAARVLALLHHRAPHTVEADDIPTLVFGGLSHLRFSHCLLLRFGPVAQARRQWLDAIRPQLSYGTQKSADLARVLAFTAAGLQRLGLDERAMATFPTAFQQGMSARFRALGDDTEPDHPDTWWWGASEDETRADAVLVLYARSEEALRREVERRTGEFTDAGHEVVHRVALRPIADDEAPLREPFGFIDGISQPVMRGTEEAADPSNAIHLVEPGEMVLGYPNNLGYVAPVPRSNGSDIGRNGTYLVIRHLEQDVGEFTRFLTHAATEIAMDPRVPVADPREWIAAKMTGRWRADGSSLVRHPDGPLKEAHEVKRSDRADNVFLYGRDDPDGLRCPFGSHIRRANPRDSFDPGSQVQIAISNRHRILRVGRPYAPQNGSDKPGLLFMCINADIEGQFEFLQQTWMHGASFHGLEDEVDPVVGHRHRRDLPEEAVTIPTHRGPLRLKRLKDFVKVRGGGYFFMPGRASLERIINVADTRAPAAPAAIEARRTSAHYTAPWWLPGAHLQTLAGAFPLSRVPSYSRERWQTSDGDFIDVDFAGPPEAPNVLVLFHGLEGNSRSEYARILGNAAVASGRWRFAVPHFRGCSGEPNVTPRAYHAGDSAEIHWIMGMFRELHERVYAAGVSLGANALLKWLGERGLDAQQYVRRAVAVSAPFHLKACGTSLLQGPNLGYARFFLRNNLREKALALARTFPKELHWLDAEKIRGAATLRDFEDAVTAPLHDFRNVQDYWRRASAGPFLRHIRVPTLLLNARNDPFLPDHVLRMLDRRHADGRLPPELVLEFPPEGGHAGFAGRGRWLGGRVLEFLEA